jgi:hypothetical protein
MLLFIHWRPAASAARDSAHLTSLAQVIPKAGHPTEPSGETGPPLTIVLWNLRAREKRAAAPADRGAPAAPAAATEQTRRLLNNRPCLGFSMKSPDPKERLRVSNWIVQRLYNHAVNETVKLRFLAVFLVADKNSAITPLDLRPTVAASRNSALIIMRLSS